MLKLNKNKWIAYLLAFSSLTSFSYASNGENLTNQENSADEGIVNYAAHSRDKVHRPKDLTLRDFAGEWVLQVRSVGGVAGPTAVGVSTVVDGQVTFDGNGNGTFNFGTKAVYKGIVGSLITVTIPPGTQALTLSITDPVHAVGSLAVNDPATGFVDTVDVIAIRNREGRVIRFEGHPTAANPTLSDIGAYTFVRQTVR